MQALCGVFSRKKVLYFQQATHLVAILFCHYIFLFLTFSGSAMGSDLPCHYKKQPGKSIQKTFFTNSRIVVFISHLAQPLIVIWQFWSQKKRDINVAFCP